MIATVECRCPDCCERFEETAEVEVEEYDYADMYVDYLRGIFDLQKFIESFGRDLIRKEIYKV
jgi:phosphoglucomutase